MLNADQVAVIQAAVAWWNSDENESDEEACGFLLGDLDLAIDKAGSKLDNIQAIDLAAVRAEALAPVMKLCQDVIYMAGNEGYQKGRCDMAKQVLGKCVKEGATPPSPPALDPRIEKLLKAGQMWLAAPMNGAACCELNDAIRDAADLLPVVTP